MRAELAESTGKAPALRLICQVLQVAPCSLYASREPRKPREQWAKPGPKTHLGDQALVEAIRRVIRQSPFHGEGHRKVWVRLRREGVRVGRNRVLRLMRENGLLAPTRRAHVHGDKAHAGRIVEEAPNCTWGTDATRFWTEEEGWCWFFGALDHCCDDVVGWEVVKRGDRFAALEPIRQGLREHFGGVSREGARGLVVRCDHGPQYTSDDFWGELAFCGIEVSYAYVGEPECNGIVERFLRTLKEQVLWVHRFRNLEEARRVIGEFIARYNRHWLIQRLGYRSPAQVRESFLALQEAA